MVDMESRRFVTPKRWIEFLTSTADWAAARLRDLDFVVEAESAGEVVTVVRAERPAVKVAVLSARDVVEEHLAPFIDDGSVRFVLNVPKLGRFMGSAIAALEARGKAWGGLADSYRALRDFDDPAQYEERELTFALRGIDQHSAVLDWVLLDDHRVSLQLASGRHVTVLVCADYQPTAQLVRELVSRYEEFDIIASTNPNGDPTDEAYEAAESVGRRVLQWRPLLRELHKI